MIRTLDQCCRQQRRMARGSGACQPFTCRRHFNPVHARDLKCAAQVIAAQRLQRPGCTAEALSAQKGALPASHSSCCQPVLTSRCILQVSGVRRAAGLRAGTGGCRTPAAHPKESGGRAGPHSRTSAGCPLRRDDLELRCYPLSGRSPGRPPMRYWGDGSVISTDHSSARAVLCIQPADSEVLVFTHIRGRLGVGIWGVVLLDTTFAALQCQRWNWDRNRRRNVRHQCRQLPTFINRACADNHAECACQRRLGQFCI